MPNRNYLTSGLTTEAQFQSGIGDLYDVVNQLGIIGPSEQIGIVLGSITPTKCDVVVDTEGLASTDILDLISPTNIGEKILFLRCKNASRQVTVTHLASGTGKIQLATQLDTVLADPKYVIALKWDATAGLWVEYWRNFGVFVAAGDEANIRTSLGLGTAATKNTGMLTGQIPLRENFGSAAFVNTGTSTGQVPLANQLGSLAFKSLITNSELDGSGVTPGTYSSVTVNAQGRVTGGSNTSNARGVAKAMVTFNGSTMSVISSFGVASVSRTTTGTFVVTLSTPFINNTMTPIATCDGSGPDYAHATAIPLTASTCQVRTGITAYGVINSPFISVVFYGDQ